MYKHMFHFVSFPCLYYNSALNYVYMTSLIFEIKSICC